MENKPTETTPEEEITTPEVDAAPATEETPTEETPEDASSSTEESEDLSSLIEEERKSGQPDPEKARERFLKKQKEQEQTDPESDDEPTEMLTRQEVEEMIARQTREATLVAQEQAILDLSGSIAESEQEAELIREIHKNRVFPTGMPLKAQLEEARAIASYKRTQAKTSELARKVQSQQTASRSTATTHRDPQAAVEPNQAPDLAASMKRAGYTWSGGNKRYEKTLPNGKTLVKENGKPPYIAG